MRRMILGVFFLLAACGGDLRNNTDAVNRTAGSDMRAAREQFLMTREAHDVIAQFAKSASQDSLDTCLNAYVDDVGPGPNSPQEGNFIKPSPAGLKAYLAACLGVPVPANLRSSTADLRSAATAEARSAEVR